MISAQHISVQKSGRWILRDVSLGVRPGELVAMTGANGAGKSTLLKCIAGAMTPSKGQVRLNGQLLKQWHN